MKPELSLFYMTCPNQETALKISDSILKNKLVACTQILPGVTSQYWWEGKLETAQELVLILKGPSENKVSIEKIVKELHPYENPCFLQVAIEGGSQEYLNWLQSI